MNSFAKTTLSLAFTAALLSAGTANAFTGSETHDLTLTGTVESNPCTVAVPPTITFGDISVDVLKLSSATTSSDAQLYEIDFSNCMAGQMAQVAILGTGDAYDNSILANSTAEGAASNVGVAFWDASSNTEVKLAVNGAATTATNVGTAAGESTSGKIILKASLVKPEDKAATAGAISTTAQVQINYL